MSDLRDMRPEYRCPKCGVEYGFLHSRPVYVPGHDVTDADGRESWQVEQLHWACFRCGYVMATDTADAK